MDDNELPDEINMNDEAECTELPDSAFMNVTLHPEDVDAIFNVTHNSINMIHQILSNVYKNLQITIRENQLLQVERDTVNSDNEELKKTIINLNQQIADLKQTIKGEKENGFQDTI